MTNFAAHWDYQNHCPKKASHESVSQSPMDLGRSSRDSQKRAKGWLCKINPRHCWIQRNNQRRSFKSEKKSLRQEQFESSSPEKIFEFPSSKGYLLEDLWRRGIPNKFRRKLWPFAIQNKLEISKQLYRMNLKEGMGIVSSLNRQQRTQKKGLTKQILEKMNQDIQTTLQFFKKQFLRESSLSNRILCDKQNGQDDDRDKIFEEAKSLDNQTKKEDNDFDCVAECEMSPNNGSSLLTHDSLFNVLIAFIMQRPDIGYLPVSPIRP